MFGFKRIYFLYSAIDKQLCNKDILMNAEKLNKFIMLIKAAFFWLKK